MQTIFTQTLNSPLGDMLICATERGVCLLEFIGSQRIIREQNDLARLLHAQFKIGENQHLHDAKQQIQQYFAGERQTFKLALDAPATAFQQKVWQALQHIEFGQTTHYQALAQSIGQPTAMRAVANANGANRISIIIPCHRVIGKDGSLTGYGGGLARKQWLLQHEAAQFGTQPAATLPLFD